MTAHCLIVPHVQRKFDLAIKAQGKMKNKQQDLLSAASHAAYPVAVQGRKIGQGLERYITNGVSLKKARRIT